VRGPPGLGAPGRSPLGRGPGLVHHPQYGARTEIGARRRHAANPACGDVPSQRSRAALPAQLPGCGVCTVAATAWAMGTVVGGQDSRFRATPLRDAIATVHAKQSRLRASRQAIAVGASLHSDRALLARGRTRPVPQPRESGSGGHYLEDDGQPAVDLGQPFGCIAVAIA
jgi:hypothetical protein